MNLERLKSGVVQGMREEAPLTSMLADVVVSEKGSDFNVKVTWPDGAISECDVAGDAAETEDLMVFAFQAAGRQIAHDQRMSRNTPDEQPLKEGDFVRAVSFRNGKTMETFGEVVTSDKNRTFIKQDNGVIVWRKTRNVQRHQREWQP